MEEATGHVRGLVVVCHQQLDTAIGGTPKLGLVHSERQGLDAGPSRFLAQTVQIDRPVEVLDVDGATGFRSRAPNVDIDLGLQTPCLGVERDGEGAPNGEDTGRPRWQGCDTSYGFKKTPDR